MNSLPNVKQAPLIQLLEWIADPIAYMENNFKRYGDIFVARWQGLNPFVFVNHPEDVQQLLGGDPRQFTSGAGGILLKPILGEYSLLLLDGESHQRQRKLLMPPFHGDRLRLYDRVIGDIARTVFQNEVGKTVHVRSVMQKISLGTILKVIFGMESGENYRELEQVLSKMLEAVASPWRASTIFFTWLQQPWTPWGKFLVQRQQIDRIIFTEIENRRDQAKLGNDILSLLISARDEAGMPMTNQELRDQLLTLLIAGHETTASSLSWCLYLIDRHPDVKEKLEQEIKTWDRSIDSIGKLTYLQAVCQEALRLYPIAILTEPRIPSMPMNLGGYSFAEGTVFVPCIYLVHRRPEIYTDPETFNPGRFLERQFSAYEYFPFGGGNRRCIGAAFALWEMKIVLLTMLTEFNYKILPDPYGRPIKGVRRGVTVAPSSHLKMEIKPKT